MAKRPLDAARHFRALHAGWQIILPALARVITVILFDLTTLAILALTGASIQTSVWISGFYFPAGLIVFFAFVGSPWAVLGVALGTFGYLSLFRDLSWQLNLAASLPSAMALLITMIFFDGMQLERRRTPLSLHVSYGQIATIAGVYAFWNFIFYYILFTLLSEELQTRFLLNYKHMALMIVGDFLGAAVILAVAKTIFAKVNRRRMGLLPPT